jgi:hypothetical protein
MLGRLLILGILLFAVPVEACSLPILEGVDQIPFMHYKGGVLTPSGVSPTVQIELLFHTHPNHAPAATCP